MGRGVRTSPDGPSEAAEYAGAVTSSSAAPPPLRVSRKRWTAEVWIVLGLSLGQSAVYSLLSIIEKLSRPEPLNEQTTSMNNAVVPDRPWLDLAYQLAGIVFPLVPVVLVLYLMRLSRNSHELGFDLRRPGFDLSRGLGMAALIGLPGLAFYFVARELGFNTNVAPANLTEQWWTILVLVGLAVMNGVLEEVIMLGYLFTRLRQLAWGVWAIVLASAVLRGTYHLYQGFGGFVGNLVMGIVFGLAYLRWRRVGPLVAAHVILDLVAFIGYSLVAPYTELF